MVILYEHPLLGEGLERLLRTEHDLAVELVHIDGFESARAALETAPDVVILERCAPVKAIDLLGLAPSALFLDVGLDAGPSWAYRRDELSPQPEEVLRAISERLRGPSHPASHQSETCRRDPVAPLAAITVEAVRRA